MKTCFHCQVSQLLAAFAHSPNSRSPDKLGILCASCRAHLSPKEKARLETAFWRAGKKEQADAQNESKIPDSDERLSLWTKQSGQCAVCAQSKDPQQMRLHCSRATGAARGLLCRNCHRALTMLRDDPALFQKAAAYLLQSS